MGRVLSVEELQHGKIPEPGAHQAAGDFIMKQICGYAPGTLPKTTDYFDIEHHEEFAWQVMVYGSTALGLANVRSDVDIAVSPHDAVAIGRIFTKAEETFNITVESHLLDVAHRLDPFFVDHLKTIQENPRWSVGWPAAGLRGADKFTTEELRLIAAGYMQRKATEFTRAQINYRGNVNLHTFQRALELPIAIARKTTYIDEGAPADLSQKTAVLGQFMLRLASYENSYRELFSGFKADSPTEEENQLLPFKLEDLASLKRPTTTGTDIVRRLIQMNIVYNDLLDETVASRKYRDYKLWLAEQYPVACELAIRSAQFCAGVVGFAPEELSRPAIQAALEEEAANDSWLDY